MDKIVILTYSYWEHIKAEKDLSFIYPPEHPKRIALHESATKILDEINKIRNEKT